MRPTAFERNVSGLGDEGSGRRKIGWATRVEVSRIFEGIEAAELRAQSAVIHGGKHPPRLAVDEALPPPRCVSLVVPRALGLDVVLQTADIAAVMQMRPIIRG